MFCGGILSRKKKSDLLAFTSSKKAVPRFSGHSFLRRSRIQKPYLLFLESVYWLGCLLLLLLLLSFEWLFAWLELEELPEFTELLLLELRSFIA